MSDNPLSTESSSSLVNRAKAIIMTPKPEWAKIALETSAPKDVLLKYALPLILIGPVASFIGSQIFGYGALGIYIHPTLASSLTVAVITLVSGLVSLFVIAFAANFLSPKFAGKDDFPAAFRLVAYSMTASWLAGIFGLVPALSILSIVGLYSLYLFYLGATPVMGVPEDKAVGYTAVTVVLAIVVMFVFSLITTSLTASALYSVTL
jgi:hypothetical protein